MGKEVDLLFICPICSTFQRRKVLKKTNFSWDYPLPIATSPVIQLFVIKIKLVLLAVWKMGEIGEIDALTLAHVCSVLRASLLVEEELKKSLPIISTS